MGHVSCFNLAVFYPLSFTPAALDGRPKDTFSLSIPVAPTATLVVTYVGPLLHLLMRVGVGESPYENGGFHSVCV